MTVALKTRPSSKTRVQTISLTSDPNRDWLAAAQHFTDVPKALVELLTNSLDAILLREKQLRTEFGVDGALHPRVLLDIRKADRRAVFLDNGVGMLLAQIRDNFYRMHSQSRVRAERVAGGRGAWGTGAKGGLAQLCLRHRIVSVAQDPRDGRYKQTVVEFDHGEVERATREGRAAEIRVLEADRPVGRGMAPIKGQNTGTRVEMLGIRPNWNVESIRAAFSDQLYSWSRAEVVVDARPVAYQGAKLAGRPRVFRSAADPKAARALGKAIVLTVGLSLLEMKPDRRGVAIRAEGILMERLFEGFEGRALANYLTGDVDCSKLNDLSGKVSPFDASRSLRLNRDNPTAAALVAWVASCMEKVRQAEVLRREALVDLQQETRLRRIGAELGQLAERWLKRSGRTLPPMAGILREDPEGSERMSGTMLEAGPGLPPPPAGETAGPGTRTGPRDGGSSSPARRGRPAEMAATREPGLRIEFKDRGAKEWQARCDAASWTITVNKQHPKFAALLDTLRETDAIVRAAASDAAFNVFAHTLAQRDVEDGRIAPDDAVEAAQRIYDELARLLACYWREVAAARAAAAA